MDKEKIKGRSENELDDMVIFRLLDEVIEHGEEALPEMEDYLTATADSVDSPKVDVEASLKRFKTEHAEFFVKPRRPHHWAYRVCVAAAAVFVANTVCAFALGHSLFNYAAKWGAETFGFYRDDFPTSKDGKIIYYPDGSWDDRTNMPDYDHETYTALPESNTSSIEEYAQTLEPAEKCDPLPEYADLPDTDLSSFGLEKSASIWDDGHMTEWFNIENATLADTLSALRIKTKMAPLWLPDGYKQTYIKMTKDYLLGKDSIFTNYEDNAKHSEMFVLISKVTDSSTGTIEKDDRPVIEYTKENTTWYIMHNLQQINAVALTENYQVLISAPVSVDEMKKIIDSIY